MAHGDFLQYSDKQNIKQIKKGGFKPSFFLRRALLFKKCKNVYFNTSDVVVYKYKIAYFNTFLLLFMFYIINSFLYYVKLKIKN